MKSLWIKRVAASALGVAVASGCANLDVRKVPVSERSCGADHHQSGFRYYLSRPYVAVLDKIEISRVETIVQNNDKNLLKIVSGEKAGETVVLADLNVLQGGGRGIKPLTKEQTANIRGFLENNPTIRQTGADDGLLEAPAIAQSELQSSDIADGSALAGKIKVFFLPDLDEQYAIKSENILARSAIKLKFKDGWQLTDASAAHDSTAIALQIFQTIDKVVGAQTDIAKAKIDRAADDAKPPASTASKEFRAEDFFVMTQVTIIKPGIYRLNKPWETSETPQPVGTGLLAKLGLETMTYHEFRPLKQ